MYPAYFTKFISHWENWSKISETSSSSSYDPYNNTHVSIETFGVWDAKVGHDLQLLERWKNPKSTAETLDYYRLLLSELCTFIKNELEKSNTFWENLTINTDRTELIRQLSYLSDEDYKQLSATQRITALQIIAYTSYPTDVIEGSTETYILKLFQSTEEQADQYLILDALVEKKDSKNGTFLLPAFCKNVDNPEFSELIVLLVSWIQSRPINISDEDLIKLIINPEPIARRQIPFSGNFFAGNSEYFDANGNLTLSSKVHLEGCVTIPNEVTGQGYNSCEQTFTLKEVPPYEIISIKFTDDYSIGDQYFKKNSTIEVPAILAYMLFNNENSKRIAKTIKIGVNVLLIAASAGSYSAAVFAMEGGAELTGAWMFTKATVDAGVALTDITMTFKESELNASPEGKKILDDWNQFTHLYWNIRMGGDFAELAVVKLSQLYTSIETAIKLGRLGNIVIDEQMAQRLRNIYRDLEKRTGLAINKDLISGATGGSAFKGTYKDFLKKFGEDWPNKGDGELLEYSLPSTPGSFPPPSGFSLVEGPITNGTNPSVYVVSNPALSTSFVNKNGVLISNELKALGYKQKEVISDVALLETDELTPLIKTQLLNGTKSISQRGQLTIVELEGNTSNQVMLLTTAEKVIVIRARGTAIKSIADIEEKQKKNEVCNFCSQSAACDCFENLSIQYPLYSATIKQICDGNAIEGKSICEKLRPATYTSDFLADLTMTVADANHISKFKNALSSKLIDAWELINLYQQPLRRSNMPLLRKVVSQQDNDQLLQKLGGVNGLGEIISKNKRAPYKGCTTCGSFSYLQDIDDYLSDVEDFANRYSITPGFNYVAGSSGMKNGSVAQVEGTAFMLRVLNGSSVLQGQIVGFEETIEAIDDDGKLNTRYADIYKRGSVIVECKSWSLNGLSFDHFVKGEGSYNQFLTYLKASESLDDIEYWFDSKKVSDNTTAVKMKFQTLFNAKKIELWQVIGSKPLVLRVIGNTEESFQRSIDDLNSDLYSFIKLK